MGCYTVPAAAAVIHYFVRKKKPEWNSDKYHTWLNLMFGGAAIFGVIDHLWNRELFMFSLMDVLLGAAITVVILAAWIVIAHRDRVAARHAKKALD